MSKKIVIISSIIGGVAISCAAIVPAIVYTQYNSQTQTSTSQVNTVSTTTAKNSTVVASGFNYFNNSSTNYQNEIQSMNPNTLMNDLSQDNQKVSLFADSSMVSAKESEKSGLSTKTQELLVVNEKKIISEIDSNKLNVKKQVDNLQTNFYNNLSATDKSLVQSKISAKEYQLATSKKMQDSLKAMQPKDEVTNPNLFVLNLYSQNSNQSSELNTLRSDQSAISRDAGQIRSFAIVSSTAAAASTVLALAMLWIPFVGWFDEAFAVADTVIDWSAAGFAWKGYWSLYDDSQAMQQIITNNSQIGDYFSGANFGWDAGFVANDLTDYCGDANSIVNTMTNLYGTVVTDEATNAIGAFVEPGVDSWYSIALSTCALTLDTICGSMGTAATVVSDDIANIQATEQSN